MTILLIYFALTEQLLLAYSPLKATDRQIELKYSKRFLMNR